MRTANDCEFFWNKEKDHQIFSICFFNLDTLDNTKKNRALRNYEKESINSANLTWLLFYFIIGSVCQHSNKISWFNWLPITMYIAARKNAVFYTVSHWSTVLSLSLFCDAWTLSVCLLCRRVSCSLYRSCYFLINCSLI